MTNGEYIEKIIEQDKDFGVLIDEVAETVTIEVSLDWWNKPHFYSWQRVGKNEH